MRQKPAASRDGELAAPRAQSLSLLAAAREAACGYLQISAMGELAIFSSTPGYYGMILRVGELSSVPVVHVRY